MKKRAVLSPPPPRRYTHEVIFLLPREVEKEQSLRSSHNKTLTKLTTEKPTID
jgi:hypothetical protein